MHSWLLICFVWFCLVSDSYHLSIPDPDPSLIGPKLLNHNGQWISLVHDAYAQSVVKPIPPISNNWKDSNTIIFVSIPHYRDPRCASTVKNLLTKAKHPHRLRFGIIQQRHTEEDFFKCVDDVLMDLKGKHDASGHPLLPDDRQFRLIEFTHQQAYGPNFARSFTSQLLQEEDEFCLSIDAHMDVIQDWDVEMLTMWGQTHNEYAILSTQPPDISQLHEGSHGKVPHLCQATIDKRGMIVNLPPTILTDLDAPILAPLYSEAFSFSKCHAVKKVPNDPFLQMLYDGDEFAKFIRLWLKGYDIYTPHKVLIAHDYHHQLPVIKATNKEIDAMEWTQHGNMKKDWVRQLYDQSLHRLNHLYGKGFLTESNAFLDDDNLIAEILNLQKYGLLTRGTPRNRHSNSNSNSNAAREGERGEEGKIVLSRDLFDLMTFTGVNTIKREIRSDRCKALDWIPSYQIISSSSSSSSNNNNNNSPETLLERLLASHDPWLEEDNLFGYAAPEKLSSNDPNLIPFPRTATNTNKGEEEKLGLDLSFYAVETFTTLPFTTEVTENSSDSHDSSGPHAVTAEAGVANTPPEVKTLLLKKSPQQVVAAHFVPSPDAHRGGELWGLFQWLDSAIEQIINQIDLEFGYGHGHTVMRVILLFFPIVCLLLALAIYLLLSPEQRKRYFGFVVGGSSDDDRTMNKLK